MASLSYGKELAKLETAGKDIADLRYQEKQLRAQIKRDMGLFIKRAYNLGLNNADIGRLIGATPEAVRQHAERLDLVNPRALIKHPMHRSSRRRRFPSGDQDPD